MNFKIEFHRFKTAINLVQYASHLGYKTDKRKSTKTSVAMRLGNKDKVVISKRNGKWVYFSVYDSKDHGTIIDFIQNRTNKSLLEIGEELQSWLNDGHTFPISNTGSFSIKEQKTDPDRIKRIFKHCNIVAHNDYLKCRGITKEVLYSSRFKETVYQDRYDNAVFPHFKDGHVCGLELRNKATKRFVRGSEKTLWRSNIKKNDDTLIITEAPIDAISYQIIHNLSSGFYIATCGGFSKSQSDMIKDFIESSSQFKKIIIATDNNAGGRQIAERLYLIVAASKFKGSINRHSPCSKGHDWNDVLKKQLNI